MTSISPQPEPTCEDIPTGDDVSNTVTFNIATSILNAHITINSTTAGEETASSDKPSIPSSVKEVYKDPSPNTSLNFSSLPDPSNNSANYPMTSAPHSHQPRHQPSYPMKW